MGVTVKGLSSLQAKLGKLDPITRAAMVRGVHKGGLKIEGDAKMIVPVLDGGLKGSIHTNTTSTATSATSSVGTNLEYAARIEFGFNDEDSLGRRYNNPAQPYLQPSLQKNKKIAQKLVLTEIRNALKGL